MLCLFFFFKQKTAYEMRISDWSSDVCSSDLPFEVALGVDARVVSANHAGLATIDAGFKSLSTDGGVAVVRRGAPESAFFAFMGDEHAAQIGRASCRERVCQYV